MEIAIVGLVVAGALALMYFTRKKEEDEVKPPVDEPDFFEDWDEFKTPEELITQGAVDTTIEALEEAHQAEIQALLDQNAVAVRDYERVLAETQAQAILDAATESAAELAAQKEAEAQEARARLEAQWNLALGKAQSATERAKLAAEDAWSAYSDAYSKYIQAVRAEEIWRLDLKQAEAQVLKYTGQILTITIGITSEEAAAHAASLMAARARVVTAETNLEKWRDLMVRTHNVASRCKSDAVHAISNANDCIERVLTITADIRLLGILLSLCDRADAIARATRTKLGELESKMSALAL